MGEGERDEGAPRGNPACADTHQTEERKSSHPTTTTKLTRNREKGNEVRGRLHRNGSGPGISFIYLPAEMIEQGARR